MQETMERENRVVVLIDMDCFYCQVEEKLNPELRGKPIAVVQYNPWKGGGIIAVNYVARAMGVTRHMRGDEAKEKCPEIQLPSVPCQRGKADISKYREAGKDVAKVLQKFTPLLERASIDEAYLDITTAVNERLKSLNVQHVTTELLPNTFALGYDSIEGFVRDVQCCTSDSIDFDYEHAKQLLVGAVIVSEIRAAVYEHTGYRCSAGISHNKILAKLVCGMNKPNKQTVLPKHCVDILYKSLSIKKVKHLGGKFGDSVCEILKVSRMGELQQFTEKELQAKFDEKNGTWLYNIARGVDLEPVQARFNPKSIGCCKQFKGKSALTDLESLKKWLKDLGDEIEDRLEKDALENNRTPRQVVVSFSCQLADGRDSSSSRSYNFTADDEICGELFSAKAFELIMDSTEGGKSKDCDKNRKLPMPIKFLGISVGKFEDHNETKKTRKIMDFFSAGTSKQNNESNVGTSNDSNEPMKETAHNKENVNETEKNKPSNGDIVSCKNAKTTKADKGFILQKFFQTTDKTELHVQKTKDKSPLRAAMASTLDNQESFFAKYLNQKQNTENKITNEVKVKIEKEKVESIKKDAHTIRPTTPICKVVECGDNSNDTDYSGSTINMEINKSISLFEDDPRDVDRVVEMRKLMTTSTNVEETVDDTEVQQNDPISSCTSPEPVEETFDCEECKKTLPIATFQTHADYHFALKLREEERQIARREKQARSSEVQNIKTSIESPKVEVKEQIVKNEANTSIASFLVKIDDSAPTEVCSECRKKIPLQSFAEHLDFHEAQKLSRELNRKPVVNNFAPNSVKRKRKTLSPEKKPKMFCKPINSFFK